MMLRNGEQLLLTIVIPLLVLGVFTGVEAMDLGDRGERVDFLTPGVLALAVISTSFTGLAIGTGFERRYGALKRLGASPLPRWGLLAGQGARRARRRGAAGRPDLRARARAGLGPARVGARRRAAPARRHRRVLRARAADGGHAAGRGDAGRRQPGLPAAPRHGRDRGPAGPLPVRRPDGARAVAGRLPWRRACATSFATAPACPGRRSGCWSPGPARSAPPRPPRSAGSNAANSLQQIPCKGFFAVVASRS